MDIIKLTKFPTFMCIELYNKMVSHFSFDLNLSF